MAARWSAISLPIPSCAFRCFAIPDLHICGLPVDTVSQKVEIEIATALIVEHWKRLTA